MTTAEPFDPSSFELRQVDTPAWASQSRTFVAGISVEEQQNVLQQLPEIHRSVDAALHWALVEVKDNMWFESLKKYLGGASGEYFIARQFADRNPEIPEAFIVEVECCFIFSNQSPVARKTHVHSRYIVTLKWDMTRRTGIPLLARATDRESHLAQLNFTLIGNTRFEGIRGSEGLDREDQIFLTSRWEEILTCFQCAAIEAMADGSSSGELDDHFFPERISMSGEYYIDSISILEDENFLIMLHFLELPRFEGQTDRNYLGYDLDIKKTDGPLSYELWGSSSI